MDSESSLKRLLVSRMLHKQGVGKDLLQISPPMQQGDAGRWQLRVTHSALGLLLLGDDRLAVDGKPLSAEEHMYLLQQLVPQDKLDVYGASSVTPYTVKFNKDLLHQHKRAMLALNGYPHLDGKNNTFQETRGILFSCSGDKPNTEPLEAALRGMARAWLNTNPLPLTHSKQQQQHHVARMLPLHQQQQQRPLFHVLPGTHARFLQEAGNGFKGTGPAAANQGTPASAPPPAAAAAAAAAGAPNSPGRKLLRARRANNRDAMPEPPGASSSHKGRARGSSSGGYVLSPYKHMANPGDQAAAAAAAAAAGAGEQAPGNPAQPVQQEQPPAVRTQPLAGDTAMFPALADDAPVAVAFQETCSNFRNTLGQLQLRILAGKGYGGQGAVFEARVVGYSGSNPQLQAISQQIAPEQRRVAVKVLLRFSDWVTDPRIAAGWTPDSWLWSGSSCFSTELRAAQWCAPHDPDGYVLRAHAVGYVPVYTVAGEQERRPALILEYAAGGCLRDVLDAHAGKLDRDPQQVSHKAWQVAQRMFRGLWVAPKAMVVHRDCKPDNFFLGKEGDVTSVKLGDFGVALLVQEAGTRGSTLVYTPGYEAPEVVDRLHNGTEMDVWLLGCSLLSMLTGQRPFYHTADLPPEDRKALRHGGELVRPGSPYCDPQHPDYDDVGRHLTQAERDILQKLLQQDPGKRPCWSKVMALPYMMWGPQGRPAR